MNAKKYLNKLSDFLKSNRNNSEAVKLARVINKIAGGECPKATKDIELNTKNRNSTRDKHNYGPLNPSEPSKEYWEKIAKKWKATPKEAMKSRCYNCVAFDISPRMKDCMPLVDKGLDEKFGDDIPGLDMEKVKLEFGYCWMHHFKCLSARTCDTWAGGGPIDENEVSHEWEDKNK